MSRFSALRSEVTDEELGTGEAELPRSSRSGREKELSEEEEEEEKEEEEVSPPERARQRLDALQLRHTAEEAAALRRRGKERAKEASAATTQGGVAPTTPRGGEREAARRARVGVAGTDKDDAPPPAEAPGVAAPPGGEEAPVPRRGRAMHRGGAAATPARPEPALPGEEEASITALLARLPHGVTRVGALEYELSREWVSGGRMHVPARFFASAPLLRLLVEEVDAAEGGATGGGCVPPFDQTRTASASRADALPLVSLCAQLPVGAAAAGQRGDAARHRGRLHRHARHPRRLRLRHRQRRRVRPGASARGRVARRRRLRHQLRRAPAALRAHRRRPGAPGRAAAAGGCAL
jgi:hypothetical protein